MNDTSISGNARESATTETEITLGVLDAVHANASVTQRSVAQDVGIALGLANSYLKRCVRKGLIKVQQMPPNRYAYYLTPHGISEKARLSAEYLSSSFNFFRRAKDQCEQALQVAKARGWKRVGLVGRSELAEIAALCNIQGDLELVVVEPEAKSENRFAGLKIVSETAVDGLDGMILTDLANPQGTYDRVGAAPPYSTMIVPAVLRVVTREQEKASS